jgi:hypothetical protein
VVSCDVLVGGVVLYPSGVTIDFWEEITYYHFVWQTKVNHKITLLMRFIGGQLRKSNKSTMLVGFSSLLHGFELLEGNIHDQDASPTRELAMSRLQGMSIIPIFLLDPKPPWHTLTKHY